MKKKLKEIFSKGMFIAIGGYPIDFPIGQKWDDIDGLLGSILKIVDIAINFAAVAAIAMIVVGGYLLMMAGGDPEKVERGQKTLTNSIIGLAIVIVVKLIIKLVLDLFT
jgi:hypothetical protein